MGELIDFQAARERRAAARAPRRMRAELFFDLACPWTYLVAERVERAFDEVIWTPAVAAHAPAVDRAAVERSAAALRLPLVWPDPLPAALPAATRVAALAQERGRGAAFALAATRLAFCGGFNLEEPETLAEAAAAAGLPLDDCLAAARDLGRDGAGEQAGRGLLAAGADTLPALRAGGSLYAGERAIAAALTAARSARAAGVR